MPPWIQSVPLAGEASHPWQLAGRLLLAMVLGLIVAGVYKRTNGGEVVPSFLATILLLTILIAAITQVIGDNVARAFSLVGALSIVRFRTVVQDTRDTAFVIFAVTVGMAVGAGDLWVAGLALIVVGGAAALFRPRGPAPAPGGFQMIVSMSLGRRADQVLAPVLAEHALRAVVVGVATTNRGAALETTYDISLKAESSPSALVDAVNDQPGVQSVQVRLVDRFPR